MKSKNNNPLTLKIKYSCSDEDSKIISSLLQVYNPILRFTYNRVADNPNISTKELTNLQKEMNNRSESINSHLLNSIQYQAKALYNSRPDERAVIFGGRSNFIKRCKNIITKEEWNELRLCPIYSVGEANQKGNRLFQILDINTILFKPNKNTHIKVILQNVGKNYAAKLKRLKQLQDQKALPLTFQIDKEYIYITYNNSIFENYNYAIKTNRVIAIDMNPNYIGWSVVDWKDSYSFNLVATGMFSLKPLNDYRNSIKVASTDSLSIYVTNKRNYEIIEIAKQLFTICKHYHCESFTIEELSIPSAKDDTIEVRHIRKLINNHWNRDLLIQQIRKHIKSSSTQLIEVKSEYSSIIGNLVNRKLNLPDPVLASIEIGRRGFEFGNQYIYKRRPIQKTVIFPSFDVVKQIISLSLEELGVIVPTLKKWEDVFQLVKNSEVKYRVPLSNTQLDSPCSKFYKRKYLTVYNF